MGLFHKNRTHSQQVNAVSDVIAHNYKKTLALAEICADTDTYKASLLALAEEIHFLNPSVKASVQKIDHRIGDMLDDIRVLLARKDVIASDVEDAVHNIRLQIAARRAEA